MFDRHPELAGDSSQRLHRWRSRARLDPRDVRIADAWRGKVALRQAALKPESLQSRAVCPPASPRRDLPTRARNQWSTPLLKRQHLTMTQAKAKLFLTERPHFRRQALRGCRRRRAFRIRSTPSEAMPNNCSARFLENTTRVEPCRVLAEARHPVSATPTRCSCHIAVAVAVSRAALDSADADR